MHGRRRKSQEKLQSALGEMLREQAPAQISIDALAHRAGVTRQTFYANYTSIDDMLGEVFDAVLAAIELRRSCISTAELSRDFEGQVGAMIQDILDGMDAADPRLRTVLAGGSGIDAGARLASLMGRLMELGEADGSGCRTVTSDLRPFFLSGALLGLLRYWVFHAEGRTARDVAVSFAALATNGIIFDSIFYKTGVGS